MMRSNLMVVVLLAAVNGLTTAARSESPDEWITLGARVHGGFGTFIPVGIRIGLDALQRLNAKAREVTVVYYDSDKAPCACLADGVAIATVASVGQRTLQIAPEKATVGAMAIIIIRRKQSGEAVKYTVADSWLPKLAEWNQTLDPRGRYDAVMKAEGLFDVMPMK
jgi:formylmethanofuran dehydrogenase subunit E